MLSRYTIYRRRPTGAPPLPAGERQDTRYRTRHILRPTQVIVESYLAAPTETAFSAFQASYLELLSTRWNDDRSDFDQLANLAREQDVFLGCSCPTQKNPDVRHCHTWMALQFMAQHFPDLEVIFPEK
ncbi:hypothetical protein C5Y96_25380 [Blastopirellula marina]|uniref:DUF488 domain-containing protein n=1 Tax=Blastopirellula marina TaxID=124 RepID=A0A2S8EZN1_9BACT|nr:hypothetical protein C5Y96_25380 [Blastopirellula marina]RCS41780.1 hypothetical protein DTL36_25430 [Bremerella cremea]